MLEAFALTDPGKVRPTNQDAFRIIPELGLFLLADGMGGARGGERASQIAVDTVSEILSRASHRNPDTLLCAVKEVNRRVLEEAGRDPRLEGMGTTLVAVLDLGNNDLDDNDLAIASVGDSRAWLAENRKLRAITEDQTWVNEIGRGLGLDEGALKNHPMRHVLTMAIGVAPEVRIRYYAIVLKPGAIVMLSSDGLHGVVPEQEIEHILLDGAPGLDVKCRQLVSAANDAGSPDNVTVLLIRRAA